MRRAWSGRRHRRRRSRTSIRLRSSPHRRTRTRARRLTLSSHAVTSGSGGVHAEVPVGTHTHHPRLQHHFDTLEQQQHAATLGMWVFLMTEVLFFGGLFLAYTLYRMWYPDMFLQAHKHLNIPLGAANTIVLIGSSLTMAMAVRSAQLGERGKLVVFLILTMILGAGFLGIKA